MSRLSTDLPDEQTDAGAGAEVAVQDSMHVLKAAMRAVEEEIRGHLPHLDASHRDLIDRLEELVRVVESGEEPHRYRGLLITDAALTQWLVDELRSQLVREWALLSPLPPAAELIELLESLERVRDELSASSDQQLARLLTSFRGLELPVELAHDLRSPLTSIIFLSEALREQQSGKVNPLQSRQLGIIYSAALGLVSMASDVIELVRGDGLLAHVQTSFSIGELLGSIRDLVDPIAETKGLSLRVDAPENDHRLGHPVAISRVLLNLTSNALKFTEHGSVEIGARELGGSRLQFYVRDTGPGIETDAGDLFSAIRVNSTGDRHGFSGSGLGLAICRRLLSTMGAELRYESTPGEGTHFFFDLELPGEELDRYRADRP